MLVLLFNSYLLRFEVDFFLFLTILLESKICPGAP